MKLTDGRQAPFAPSWHYWALVLLVLPIATIAVLAMATLASAQGLSGEMVFGVAVASLPLSAMVLVHERAARRMPPWRRAVWSVLGALFVSASSPVIIIAYYVVTCLPRC